DYFCMIWHNNAYWIF
nr:immunoglobulin light chain junction region [Macaca mulatta]